MNFRTVAKFIQLIFKIIVTTVETSVAIAFGAIAIYGLYMVLFQHQPAGFILTIWFGMGVVLMLMNEVSIWRAIK
jgi:hypothetical protein